MTRHHNHEQSQSQDPAALWRSALATFVGASVDALTAWLHREYAESVHQELANEPAVIADSETHEDAAALLGIDLSATVDEIRAAFRERVKCEMRSGTFHDQGGEATDDQARRLIAAKNLLIERATEVVND